MAVVTFTQENFDQEVLKSSDIAIVDFWATWCGPCKMFSPIIDEIAEENHPGLKVGKVNVDEQPDLAGQYRVMSIPTLLVFKGGKVVATSVGVQSKKAVLDMVEKARQPKMDCVKNMDYGPPVECPVRKRFRAGRLPGGFLYF